MTPSSRLVLLLALSLRFGSPARLAKATPSSKLAEITKLLHRMRETVLEEGKTQADLFGKFKCYCRTNTAALTSNIEAASRLIQPLRSVARLVQHSRCVLAGGSVGSAGRQRLVVHGNAFFISHAGNQRD